MGSGCVTFPNILLTQFPEGSLIPGFSFTTPGQVTLLGTQITKNYNSPVKADY
jgi:hypothetical protein